MDIIAPNKIKKKKIVEHTTTVTKQSVSKRASGQILHITM